MNNNLLKQKNSEGEKLLYSTKLEYVSAILKIFKEHPDIFNDVLEEMGVTPEELTLYLSEDANANVGFYDNLLVNALEKVKKQR